MNFLERLEAKTHQEGDTEARANGLSKISSQIGDVMLLGPPCPMPWGIPAMPQESGSKCTRFGRFGLACGFLAATSFFVFKASL